MGHTVSVLPAPSADSADGDGLLLDPPASAACVLAVVEEQPAMTNANAIPIAPVAVRRGLRMDTPFAVVAWPSVSTDGPLGMAVHEASRRAADSDAYGSPVRR
jgi:hypothetical protein